MTAPQDETPQQLIDRLIRERQTPPAVPPQEPPSVEPIESRVGLPASAVDLDPSIVGVLPGTPLPKLRREGEFILERPGRLVELEQGGFVFVFDTVAGQPDLRPMILQPSQRLASIQDAAAHQTSGDRSAADQGARPAGAAPNHPQPGASFTLTGQVYTYRGINYLLPTAIAGNQRDSQPNPGDTRPSLDESTTGAAPEQDSSPPAQASSPASPQTPVTFDSGSHPGELMDELLQERRAVPQRQDTAGPEAAAAGDARSSHTQSRPTAALAPAVRGIKPAVTPAHEPLRREGDYLVNRAGRLIRGGIATPDAPAQPERSADVEAAGPDADLAVFEAAAARLGAVVFAFEADGRSESAEPPMIVLPSKMRELMEDTILEHGDHLVFLISGRVFTYHGANYLLPTTMRLQPDLGNLNR